MENKAQKATLTAYTCATIAVASVAAMFFQDCWFSGAMLAALSIYISFKCIDIAENEKGD